MTHKKKYRIGKVNKSQIEKKWPNFQLKQDFIYDLVFIKFDQVSIRDKAPLVNLGQYFPHYKSSECDQEMG